MYRIIEDTTCDTHEKCFTVQKNRKFGFVLWKWHTCKLEIFTGPGTIIYPACFKTREEAENYIAHNSSMVNALIVIIS